MLETEIKKLTAALEANTAALLGGNTVAPANTAQADAVGAVVPAHQAPVTQPPIIPAVAQAPVTQPPITPPVQQAVQPLVQAPVVTPGAPQMTQAQAQQALGAIVQKLGDASRVQEVMRQYGSDRLNEIPVENLFSMVQACDALVAS